jgi:hypothetical protein
MFALSCQKAKYLLVSILTLLYLSARLSLSGRSGALLPLSPLRTVRETFTSYGSSSLKADQTTRQCNELTLTLHYFEIMIFRLPGSGAQSA